MNQVKLNTTTVEVLLSRRIQINDFRWRGASGALIHEIDLINPIFKDILQRAATKDLPTGARGRSQEQSCSPSHTPSRPPDPANWHEQPSNRGFEWGMSQRVWGRSGFPYKR